MRDLVGHASDAAAPCFAPSAVWLHRRSAGRTTTSRSYSGTAVAEHREADAVAIAERVVVIEVDHVARSAGFNAAHRVRRRQQAAAVGEREVEASAFVEQRHRADVRTISAERPPGSRAIRSRSIQTRARQQFCAVRSCPDPMSRAAANASMPVETGPRLRGPRYSTDRCVAAPVTPGSDAAAHTGAGRCRRRSTSRRSTRTRSARPRPRMRLLQCPVVGELPAAARPIPRCSPPSTMKPSTPSAEQVLGAGVARRDHRTAASQRLRHHHGQALFEAGQHEHMAAAHQRLQFGLRDMTEQLHVVGRGVRVPACGRPTTRLGDAGDGERSCAGASMAL